MATKPSAKTVYEIMDTRQDELISDWVDNTIEQAGTRVLELISREELEKEARDILRVFTKAFQTEQYTDIEQPEFADSVARMRDLSATRAQQGFSPTETTIFIFSFKDALLKYLQEELSGTPQIFVNEVIKMNKIIDLLSMVTFETFVITREAVIGQQSRSLLELSTPVLTLWDEIIMLPLVGVIDTQRAQQLIESLLEALVRTESQVAILDLTGVPAMDTKVAESILKAVSAAQMLGSEVLVTGISADGAQTLTKLGIDLSKLRTRNTLRRGLAEALSLVGLQVSKKNINI